MGAEEREARYRNALLQIVKLGEQHVEEAQMRRLRDFREAIKIAADALGLTDQSHDQPGGSR